MLILSRNKGQKIMLNHDIVISIVDIGGDQVRIGIEAPTEVSIYREEIYEAIQQQNKDSIINTDEIGQLLLDFNLPTPKKTQKNF
ncbi:carbon storage regulator CsrA [Paenibacillus brevis]|uniref:Translational regulator CsrA n=1 Tax=Paenibacillus brevis TaxID=2841508 RepID=A0ABS6FN83_9BACL|nr:carbon storage regulator CsrA [Paenibacillus brevis]MBU5670952.1 carbon storage regulator CsrA [Paenibacillus brevis]